MPSIFTFGRYVIFFWTSENGKPVHVHVAVRRPTENATKLWLTADGGCLLANNNSRIPPKDLGHVMELVTYNHAEICRRWCEVFEEREPRFYR